MAATSWQEYMQSKGLNPDVPITDDTPLPAVGIPEDEARTDEERGIIGQAIDHVGNGLSGVGAGVMAATESAIDAGHDLGEALGIPTVPTIQREDGTMVELPQPLAMAALPGEIGRRLFGAEPQVSFFTKTEAKALQVKSPIFGELDEPDAIFSTTDSAVGGAAKGISQFLTGWAALGRVKMLAGGVSKVAMAAKATARGGAAGALAFDPQEERLSNLINDMTEDNPALIGPLTRYLAADEDDSNAEGRMKAFIEESFIGVPVEAAMMAFRGWRALRAAKSQEEADAVIQKTAEDLSANVTPNGAPTDAPYVPTRAPITPDEVVIDVDTGGVQLDPAGVDALNTIISEQGLAAGVKEAAPSLFLKGDTVHIAPRDTGPLLDYLEKVEGLPEFVTDGSLKSILGRIADSPALQDLDDLKGINQQYRDGKLTAGMAQRLKTEALQRRHQRVLEAKPMVDKSILDELDLASHSRIMGGHSELLEGIFNHSKMDGPDAAQSTIKLVSGAIAPRIGDFIKMEKLTLEQMRQRAGRVLADDIGVEYEQLIERQRLAGMTAERGIADFLASKMAMQSMARDIARLTDSVDKGRGGEAVLMQRIQQLAELIRATKAVQTSAARITGAGRIRTRDILDPAKVDLILQGAGGVDNIRKFAKRFKAAGDDVSKMRQLLKPGFWDVHNEYFINALLSNPPTHVINALSGAVQSLQVPMEKMVGGALSGQWGQAREGFKHLQYLSFASKEAIQFSWSALKSGDNVLDASASPLEFAQGHIRMDGDSWLAGGVNFLGKVVRMPSRMLLTGDEFFKQLTYRASLRSRLTIEAAEKFPGQTPADVKARVNYIVNKWNDGFDPVSGQGVDTQALEEARRATFTQPLNRGTMGHSIQQLAAKHPALRTILPFIRTPVNIFRQVWASTPGINAFQKEWRENMAAGGHLRAKAAGQMAMGTLYYTAAYSLVTEGRITGGGPRDPELLRIWRESGWQPYSYRTADGEYISYQRGDPVGMFFGLVADFYEVRGHLDADEEDTAILHAMGALMKNLSSKTFLTGVTNALAAASNPEDKMSYWARGMIGSYMPAGAQAFNQDPYMREARELIDGFRKKTPGLSEDLGAQTSWITGEKTLKSDMLGWDPLSPFPTSKQKDDPVLDEMVRLNHAFEKPRPFIGRYEMSPSEFERYNVLVAKPPGRKSLHERLQALIESPKYQSFSATNPVIRGYESEHPQTKAIARIINQHKDNARKMMISDNPRIEAAVLQEKNLHRAFREGKAVNLEQLQRALDGTAG